MAEILITLITEDKWGDFIGYFFGKNKMVNID